MSIIKNEKSNAKSKVIKKPKTIKKLKDGIKQIYKGKYKKGGASEELEKAIKNYLTGFINKDKKKGEIRSFFDKTFKDVLNDNNEQVIFDNLTHNQLKTMKNKNSIGPKSNQKKLQQAVDDIEILIQQDAQKNNSEPEPEPKEPIPEAPPIDKLFTNKVIKNVTEKILDKNDDKPKEEKNDIKDYIKLFVENIMSNAKDKITEDIIDKSEDIVFDDDLYNFDEDILDDIKDEIKDEVLLSDRRKVRRGRRRKEDNFEDEKDEIIEDDQDEPYLPDITRNDVENVEDDIKRIVKSFDRLNDLIDKHSLLVTQYDSAKDDERKQEIFDELVDLLQLVDDNKNLIQDFRDNLYQKIIDTLADFILFIDSSLPFLKNRVSKTFKESLHSVYGVPKKRKPDYIELRTFGNAQRKIYENYIKELKGLFSYFSKFADAYTKRTNDFSKLLKDGDSGSEQPKKKGDIKDTSISVRREVRLPETLTRQQIIERLIGIQEAQGFEADEIQKTKNSLEALTIEDLIAVARSSGLNLRDANPLTREEEEVRKGEEALRRGESELRKNRDKKIIGKVGMKKETRQSVIDKLFKEKQLKDDKKKAKSKSDKPDLLESIKRREEEIRNDKSEYFNTLTVNKDDARKKVEDNIRFVSKGRVQPKEITDIQKKIQQLREEQLNTVTNDGFIHAGKKDKKEKKPRKKNEYIDFMKQFRIDYKDYFDEELQGMRGLEKNRMIMKAGANIYKKQKQNGYLETERGLFIPEEAYPADEMVNESQLQQTAYSKDVAFNANGTQEVHQLKSNNKAGKCGYGKKKLYLEPEEDNELYENVLFNAVKQNGVSKDNQLHDSNTLSQKYSRFNNQPIIANYMYDTKGTNNTFNAREAGSANIYNRTIEHSRDGMAKIRLEGANKYRDIMRKRLGIK